MTEFNFHGHAPTYISSLIPLSLLKSLCSASQLALKPGHRSKTSSYGDRTFAVAAPKLWNNILPYNIRSAAIGQFKAHLKTFIFNQLYLPVHYVVACSVSCSVRFSCKALRKLCILRFINVVYYYFLLLNTFRTCGKQQPDISALVCWAPVFMGKTKEH